MKQEVYFNIFCNRSNELNENMFSIKTTNMTVMLFKLIMFGLTG